MCAMRLIAEDARPGVLVRDLARTPGGSLVATWDDGAIALYDGRGARVRWVRAPERERLALCRIIRATDDVLAMWGDETVGAVSLHDGSDVWWCHELDGAHSLDQAQDARACELVGDVARLCDGTLIDVRDGALWWGPRARFEPRSFLPGPVEYDPTWLAAQEHNVTAAASSDDAFVLATRERAVVRFRPGGELETVAREAEAVQALSCDGGAIHVAFEGGRVKTLPDGGRRTSPVAMTRGAYELAARGRWVALVYVAAEYGAAPGVVTVVWEGERVALTDVEGGRAVLARGPRDVLVARPGRVVLAGDSLREVRVEGGFLPSAALRHEAGVVVGAEDGRVAFFAETS